MRISKPRELIKADREMLAKHKVKFVAHIQAQLKDLLDNYALVGDTYWICDRYNERIYVKCPTCKGVGTVEAKGVEFTCTACNGHDILDRTETFHQACEVPIYTMDIEMGNGDLWVHRNNNRNDGDGRKPPGMTKEIAIEEAEIRNIAENRIVGDPDNEFRIPS